VQEICQRYGWDALAVEVMPDHIHLFVSAPPTIAPNTIAKTIKSILTVAVFKQFSGLKKRRFWGSGLFSDGCYYGSAGTVSSTTIQKYIENQKSAQ
jgi:putative transposase